MSITTPFQFLSQFSGVCRLMINTKSLRFPWLQRATYYLSRQQAPRNTYMATVPLKHHYEHERVPERNPLKPVIEPPEN